MTATAPFRADHVGSLLRPDTVQAAREAASATTVGPRGFTTSESLREVEDAAIRDAVALQEEAGLLAVTDGEYRRSFWHYDFMGALTGLDLVQRGEGIRFKGAELRPIHPTISGEIDFPDDHPMLDHYRYLASVTNVQPKISIPGPSACHFRTAKEDIAPEQYQDPEVLFADISKAYAKAVKAFYAAGCRYLQMDDIFFAYLCDEQAARAESRRGSRSRLVDRALRKDDA